MQTCLLVTHAIHRLAAAHRIMILDSGRVTHFDSFSTLLAQNVPVVQSTRADENESSTKQDGGADFKAIEAEREDEEEDEELKWASESQSKLEAYKFFARSTGKKNLIFSIVLLIAYPCVNMGMQGLIFIRT